MTSAGLLVVRAHFRDGCLGDISVELFRPPITRLFIGQLPDVVAKTVPYLYTLCAHAQRTVAQAALAAAQDELPRPVDSHELWLEVLHENLWRLLLDWPPALGLPPGKDAFIAWRNGRHNDDCLEKTQNLLADVLRPLAEKCLEKLVDRGTQATGPGVQAPQGCGNHDISPAPALRPEPWLDYWQGATAQMPALPIPTSIRAAYSARLAEVEMAAKALAEGAAFPVAAAGGEGWGVAQTLTARGVLTHAVHLDEGKVVNYRVQAPTDSFFADASALSSLLGNLHFASLDQAIPALNRAILALDPCLPYEVELQDA